MKESYLYKKLKEKKVQCRTCAHFCVIFSGEKGKCGVRKNKDGKLFSLNHKKAAAMNIDPIEKKPLFHFLPGTPSFSIGAAGCSFSCKNCQNFDISQGPKMSDDIPGSEVSPEEVIKIAKKNSVPSISYTYTDPLAFLEYALDIMKLAKEEGIKNCFVSHGFMTKETREAIIPYLDAINIDIKSFSEEFYKSNCGARLDPVLETAKTLKNNGIWTEITTLSIPTLSDKEEMLRDIAKFIARELGEETPWHISRFSGDISWKLQDLPPTPLETLERAHRIGKEEGLRYVYLGNTPGHSLEDTYCPECGEMVIERAGFKIERHDKKGTCSSCGEPMEIILNN